MKEEQTSLPTGDWPSTLQPPLVMLRQTPEDSNAGRGASGGGKPSVLFIDNLDSFSLNIADAIAQTGRDVVVLEGRSPLSEQWLDPVALHDVLDQLRPHT